MPNPIHSQHYRYQQWDGSQEIAELDADDVLKSLSDDLMNFGDLQQALRSMMQRGVRSPDGERSDGLRDLLQRLRQQRREALDRFNLSSVFEDIQRQLDEILDLERGTLDDRLDEVGPRPQPPSAADGEQGELGEPGQQQQAAPQQAEPQERGADGLTDEEKERLTEALRQRLERKTEQLDELPEDAPGQMSGLREYEFENSEAQERYEQLLEQLKQAMMNSFFNDMSQALQGMSDQDMDRMRQMIQDLNEMLEQRARGEEPDFDGFMDKYGDMFGDNPPQSLDELIEQLQQQAAQMQNMLDSLPSEMRQQLNELMQQRMGEMGMDSELMQLAQNLESLYPMRDLRNQYPFRGDEDLNLESGMNLMDYMQQLDRMERALEQVQYGGDLNNIDPDQLEELLGEEARETLDQLKNLLELLEEAGYIRKNGNTWELTPRGTRKIGEKALAEIYANLKQQSFGKHNVPETGRYGDRADDTKLYEFGDPFHLHLKETIGNAIFRGGPSVPVQLQPDDFEVYRAETLTQTATVVMLDLSWSMALRGSFQAAKKVAMALNNLIRMQYPRDSLYLVGFSAYARELKAPELPYVRWDETVLGTNMHHALLIAQQLLAKHKVGTRQIIMITDGEPTAHLEQGRSYFAYPPSPITIRETLKQVRQCTKKDIVINIFMLDRSYYLKEFVGQVARINQGRVFYTTPDELGEYLLVDFVTHRRKSLSHA